MLLTVYQPIEKTGLGRDRDHRLGRANEEETADDEHQCAEDDEAALGHSSRSFSSFSSVSSRFEWRRVSGPSSTSNNIR